MSRRDWDRAKVPSRSYEADIGDLESQVKPLEVKVTRLRHENITFRAQVENLQFRLFGTLDEHDEVTLDDEPKPPREEKHARTMQTHRKQCQVKIQNLETEIKVLNNDIIQTRLENNVLRAQVNVLQYQLLVKCLEDDGNETTGPIEDRETIKMMMRHGLWMRISNSQSDGTRGEDEDKLELRIDEKEHVVQGGERKRKRQRQD